MIQIGSLFNVGLLSNSATSENITSFFTTLDFNMTEFFFRNSPIMASLRSIPSVWKMRRVFSVVASSNLTLYPTTLSTPESKKQVRIFKGRVAVATSRCLLVKKLKSLGKQAIGCGSLVAHWLSVNLDTRGPRFDSHQHIIEHICTNCSLETTKIKKAVAWNGRSDEMAFG